ncbi:MULTISPECIES: LexA family protein [Uliginosibacterium]|jgi:DNA polymerase V|uniref:S24 family peptidase n=1 Tax=Uliginosibacterium aquaticum TaxID=2731212 RepID=A0ABX2INT9_9RHOO|nr:MULTISPECIES: S24 family peptidase [Uliginosibacterium]MDO6386740.1 S24 family peptidase [Uliginosibacterium sp. 31-12]NSL55785.1 S24 family peptidase [Uliginosibacterium aquaticum]PLK50563.1 error-prone repair protein UmuD [Uliginosibacterium sp. TH139]
MTDQIPLPFVSLVGASPSAPPEALPGIRRTRRNPARSRPLLVAGRAAEAPPLTSADDDSNSLDVHDYLVRRDEASFVFEARDDAMTGTGIFEGDLLIVDKRIQPVHGHIVLAFVNGERLVRRLHHRGHKTALQADHPDLPELLLEAGSELTIWGVVVGSFKRFWA